MVQLATENMTTNGLLSEEDDLISGLTKEELEEFNEAIDDPDNELLPAGFRVEDQTSKAPTGPFNRDHLMKYLKEEAMSSEPSEDFVPFEKKVRGKVYKPKEAKQKNTPLLPDDLSDVLDGASEEELLELAACLGIHGMLTQKQSDHMEADKAWESLKGSGLRKYKGGITIATKTKQYTDINAVNELDLDKALEQLKSHDESLTELNLNNHKDIEEEKLRFVAEEIKDNTHIKSIHMANTKMSDRVVKVLSESLKQNKTLESLNIESNFLTREGIAAVMEMVEVNTTLKELKLANQAQKIGHQGETRISKSLAKNHTLLRFGYSFESRGPRHSSNKYIMRNNDADRQRRQAEKQAENLSNGDS